MTYNKKTVIVYWLTPVNLRSATFDNVSDAVSFAETLEVDCYSISVHNLFDSSLEEN